MSYRECERCKELPEVVGTEPRPQSTVNPERIARHRVQSTNARHTVDPGNVLLRYRSTNLISCSFPDKTEHYNGAVVRTRCGLVVRIGHVCAMSAISNWEAVRDTLKSAEAHERATVLVKGLRALSLEVGDLVRRANNTLEAAKEIPDAISLAGVARSMRTEMVVVGSTWVNAVDKYGKHRGTWQEERVRIVGAEYFKSKWGHPRLRRLEQSCRKLLEEFQSGVEAKSVKRATEAVRRIEAEITDAAKWVSFGEQFFSASNLANVRRIK